MTLSRTVLHAYCPTCMRYDRHCWDTNCTNKFTSATFDIANIVYCYTKHATSVRRSTVPSLPLQLVFPGPCLKSDFDERKIDTEPWFEFGRGLLYWPTPIRVV